MPSFKIVDHIYDIQVSNHWQDAAKFISKGTVKTHKGREYRLIAKKERQLSRLKRICRGALGALAILGSLGLGYLNKKFRKIIAKLLYKQVEAVKYATLLKTTNELVHELRGTTLLTDHDLKVQLQKDYLALNGQVKIDDQIVEMGTPAFSIGRGTGIPVPDTIEEMFPVEIQAYFGNDFNAIAPTLILFLQQGMAAEMSLKALELIKDPIQDNIFECPYPEYAFSKVSNEIFLEVKTTGSLRNIHDRSCHGNYTISLEINLSSPDTQIKSILT